MVKINANRQGQGHFTMGTGCSTQNCGDLPNEVFTLQFSQSSMGQSHSQ